MQTALFTSLGISEKQGALYVAGVSLGTTTVQELARVSGLKRPTVYLYLDELTRRGLFESLTINKRRFFRAADPHVLEQSLQHNLATFQTALPKLLASRADALGKPQVRLLEGKEAILSLYKEMEQVHSLCTWSNVGEVYPPFHDGYMRLCEVIHDKGVGVREIIADTKASRRYSRLVAKVSGPTYQARLATAEGIENDTVVFGNVVALFRLQDMNMFAVRIEDATIAETMRAVFAMSWKSAKPFRTL